MSTEDEQYRADAMCDIAIDYRKKRKEKPLLTPCPRGGIKRRVHLVAIAIEARPNVKTPLGSERYSG